MSVAGKGGHGLYPRLPHFKQVVVCCRLAEKRSMSKIGKLHRGVCDVLKLSHHHLPHLALVSALSLGRVERNNALRIHPWGNNTNCRVFKRPKTPSPV